jgi:hypothetical protein
MIPSSKAGVDQLARQALVLVHLRDERRHALLREIAHDVTQADFVFREIGQRRGYDSWVSVSDIGLASDPSIRCCRELAGHRP